MKLIKIVAGGQTGGDRTALDWALAHAGECGGWCPKGRKAEDGRIDPKCPLRETPSAHTFRGPNGMSVIVDRKHSFSDCYYSSRKLGSRQRGWDCCSAHSDPVS